MIHLEANFEMAHPFGSIQWQNKGPELQVKVQNWKTLVFAYHTFRKSGKTPARKHIAGLHRLLTEHTGQKLVISSPDHPLVILGQTRKAKIYWWRLFLCWLKQLFTKTNTQ